MPTCIYLSIPSLNSSTPKVSSTSSTPATPTPHFKPSFGPTTIHQPLEGGKANRLCGGTRSAELCQLINSVPPRDVSGCTYPIESEDNMKQRMVVKSSKCATRIVSPSQETLNTNLYRHSKRRLGCSFRSRIHRRVLVSNRKAAQYQPTKNEGGSSGSAFLQIKLQKQSSPHLLRQHHSGGLHQQTRWHKISRTLRSNVENSYLV